METRASFDGHHPDQLCGIHTLDIYCVLGTPSTPEPLYLILSTSHVPTTEDAASTTTTKPTNLILMGIQPTLLMN